MVSIVLGLGNIGPEYENTRHNVGFAVGRRVAALTRAVRQPTFREYDWAVGRDYEKTLSIVLPTTYMNNSGMAAISALDRLQDIPAHMLVIADDFNLPLGTIRLRSSGSSGGQKGLQSIIDVLETDDFPRLRVGIGPITDNEDAVSFVLGKFEPDQRDLAEKSVARAAEAVIFALHHPFERVMSQFNNNPALSDGG